MSRRSLARGFSLVELLVALMASGIVLGIITGFFEFTARMRERMGLHTEAQQGLRALEDMVTQELRQAGACLPQTGNFIALDGADGGTRDRLTLRIGRTDPVTLVCLAQATTAGVNIGGVLFPVADSSGFAPGDWVYITPNGATGSFRRLVAVGPTSVTVDGGVTTFHPAGSGIYGIDQRVYQVDATTFGSPVLTVSIDGGTPQPLVDGVDVFDLSYQTEPCPPCAPVNLPANQAEWRLVRAVTIRSTVRSVATGRDGHTASYSGETSVRPRNLL